MSLRLLTCPFSCIVLASSLAFYFSPVSTYRPRCHPAPLRRHPWHSLAHCHTLYLDLSTLHTPQKKIQIVPSLVRCERHQRTHMNCAVLGCITRRENIEGCNSCSRPPLFCSSARVGQTVEVHILMFLRRISPRIGHHVPAYTACPRTSDMVITCRLSTSLWLVAPQDFKNEYQ